MEHFITIVFSAYSLCIIGFIIGFNKLKTFRYIHTNQVQTKFSIVIPFRNEAKNLPNLLDSLSKLRYPHQLFEIILVNDDSTDHSLAAIKPYTQTLPIQIISNYRQSQSPKKDAITTAINIAQYDWIITTDADCIVPKTWLECLDHYIQKENPNMIVAPVHIKQQSGFSAQFQAIDFLSMQGSTIGGFGIQYPFMANGANLAYKKSTFHKVNGFKNNTQIASGDDVFLLEDFLRYQPSKVHFLKSSLALVHTQPVNTWSQLINQRLRWAAKAKYFSQNFTKFIGVLVFLTNILTLITFGLLFTHPWLFLLVLVKWLVDMVLIAKTAQLYQHKIARPAYILTVFTHPFLTVYIAFKSWFYSFNWKGREFKS